MRPGAPLALTLALLTACSERSGTPAAPCSAVLLDLAWIESISGDPLDVLFVIGGSGADAEQHAARVRELERLVRILVTGDWDEDGVLERDGDFLPIDDLHVAVVSTNMGSGGHVVEGCAPYVRGEDGTWRDLECARSLPDFLAYDPGVEPTYATRFVACSAEQPTCGIEQPLEAALKALSPAAPTTWTASGYEPPRFFFDTAGHGDGANAGFLRPGALLSVIVLSGADDCSAHHRDLYDPSTHAGITQELACAIEPDALHPIERFVDGLIALRPHPGRVSFSVIAGIPEDLTPTRGERPDYDLLVSSDPAVRDARMQQRADESDPSRLAAACESASHGRGSPAVRLLEAVRAFEHAGADVGVASVCANDYRTAIAPLIQRIRSRVGWGSCLAHPTLVREHCELELIAPTGSDCDAITGSMHIGEDEGRAVCALPRIEPSLEERARGELPGAPGWLVDDYTFEAEWECGSDGPAPWGRLVVVPRPPYGTSPVFRCRLPLRPTLEGHGWFCGPEYDPCRGFDGVPLECDAFAGTCGVPCTSDDDCRDAELPGHVCDLRTLGELDALRFAGDATPRGFCVSPTCE